MAEQSPNFSYPPLDASGISHTPSYPYYGLPLESVDPDIDDADILHAYNSNQERAEFLNRGHRLTSADLQDDDDIDEGIQGVPHHGLASLDANAAGVDADFQPTGEETGSTDSDSASASASASDSLSEDPRVLTALQDIEEGRGKRGRGRPRGRRGAEGRGRAAQIAALIRRVDGDAGVDVAHGRGERRRRGEGRRGGRRRKGPLATAEPTQQFKEFQAKATTAFLEGDYEAAEQHVMQAIQINPEIFAAHSLLSQIYLEQGKMDQSVAVLWSGAHTTREKAVWWEVANRTSELSNQDDSVTQEQILYCYSQIVKLDPKDVEARKGKLNIWTALGNVGKAIRECQGILKISPYDLDVLQQFARYCMSQKDALRAKKMYETAIQYYQDAEPDGMSEDFSMSDLNIYLELLLQLKEYKDGVDSLKSIARWLVGRSDEDCWDHRMLDDCEWDIEDTRRLEVPGFIPGKYSIELYGESLPLELRAKLGIFRLRLGRSHLEEAMHHFAFFRPHQEDGPAIIQQYPDLLSDIANTLHDNGHHLQATEFFKAVTETGIYLTIDVWLRAASSSNYMGDLETAVKCYKKAAIQEPKNVRHKISLIELYDKLGSVKLAEEQAAEIARLGDRDQIMEARMKASRHIDWRPFEPKMPPPASISSLPQTSSSENENEEQDDGESEDEDERESKKQKKKPARQHKKRTAPVRKRRTEIFVEDNGLTPEYLRTIFNEACKLKQSLQSYESEMAERWMKTVANLIDAFSEESLFFDRSLNRFFGYSAEDRRKARMSIADIEEMEAAAARFSEAGPSSSTENLSHLPQEYKGIRFDDWLHIFCEYAFVAAHQRNITESYRALNLAESANCFSQSVKYMLHVKVTIFACAIILSDEEKLVSVSRDLIKKFPGSTDTYRLYAALTRLFNGIPTWYNSGPTQKFLMRQVKFMDHTLLDETHRKRYTFSEQERISSKGWAKEAKANGVVVEHDPVLLTLYAHILAAAGSYNNALNYYFRAYATVPNDSCLNLSIAVAYMQLAMKRQTENRHYAILQGYAFFKRYEEVRLSLVGTASREAPDGVRATLIHEREHAIIRQEIAFNEGLFWHGLGLAHLAVEAYQRCLGIPVPEVRPVSSSSPTGIDLTTNGRLDSNGDVAMTDPASDIQNTTSSEDEDRHVMEEPDFQREAAFALQQIFAIGGNTRRAREIAERWLVF